METRKYQDELIAGIKQSFAKGNKKVLATISCGAGKTVISSSIILQAISKGNNVLYIVPRQEIREQAQKTFERYGIDFNHCEIGMIQTLARHIDRIRKPDLIICDESHLSLAESYIKVFNAFPNAWVIGFTATPSRLQGSLGTLYSDLVQGVSTKWLIENHYLAPYRYFGVDLVDTSKLRVQHGEYVKHDVEELMNNSYVFGDAVKSWFDIAEGKKTIVYCSSRITSEATAQAFRDTGINAIHLGSDTPAKKRMRAVQDFRNGKLKIICNVGILDIGFDVPDCECVMLLRPTKSLTVYIQQSMRSMRYQPGKVALILDHTSNYRRFGLPDDDREWTLEAKQKKGKKKFTINIHQCPNCFAVLPSSVKQCPCCGYEFKTEREEKHIEGATLKEIVKVLPKDPSECKSFEELEEVREQCGYRFYWSLYTARKNKIKIPAKYNWLLRKLHIY